jgi:pyruvate-formate lyase-activating enzyme
MSSTYCPLPWVGLNVLPGIIAPCCYWKGQCVPANNVESVLDTPSGDTFKTIRQDMLDGKPVAGCEQCYETEQLGAKSRRQMSIEKYGIVTEPKLTELDISFDNICNLKCRGCATTASHLWKSDEEAIYGKTFVENKYVEHTFDVDCSNLTHINISGGEPFMSKNVERFLIKLADEDLIKNIHLGISTNASTMPSKAVLDSISKAKGLYLSISIDGIGDLHDYFRSGVVFDTILENIEKLNSLFESNCQITIHSTVSIYNVTQLKEIKDFFTVKYPHFNIQHRLLLWPEQLSVKNMPDKLKDIVRPIVESFGPDFDDVLEAINVSGKDVYAHFLNFHNTLDTRRKETLPNKLLADYITNNPATADSVVFFKKQMENLV